MKRALFTTLCVVIFLEIFLRIYNPFGFRIRGNEIILLQNKQFVITNDRTDKLDHPITHTKNSLGFRGPELPDRPDNFTKIIAVGGSTTEGFYLSDGKTWPEQLGARLAQKRDDVWINNAGLDGHSTFGHTILLEKNIVTLKPDVVLFLVGLNDIERSDLSDYEQTKIHSVKDVIRKAAEYSEVVSLGLNLYRSRVAGEINVRHRPVDFNHPEYAAVSVIDQDEAIARQTSYLASYRARLKHLIEITRAHHITPVLITQPAMYGAGTDPATGADLSRIKISETIDGATGWKILEMYNTITREISAEQGILLIDLAELMPKDSTYYYDFVHFSNAGAARVADIVFEKLPLTL